VFGRVFEHHLPSKTIHGGGGQIVMSVQPPMSFPLKTLLSDFVSR
jgi:hypothetical protein